jgi:hypothetical protein
MKLEYYKKVDRSMMDWGITFPVEIADYFRKNRKDIKLGRGNSIEVVWDKKRYILQIRNIDRKLGNVWQLRWDSNREFLKKIRRTFIQSYVVLKSQREKFGLGDTVGKHFRTNLLGGQQEVLLFKILTPKIIECEVFIQIKNDLNPLFERLADENVFGWLFNKERPYLIAESKSWMSVKEFKKHGGVNNVIYYLANTKKKLIYIGKAENLGRRVKTNKTHQGMPIGWDKFRYDILRPEYSTILDKVEDHTIRAFAHILKNNNGSSSLGIGSYKLVNRTWRKF